MTHVLSPSHVAEGELQAEFSLGLDGTKKFYCVSLLRKYVGWHQKFESLRIFLGSEDDYVDGCNDDSNDDYDDGYNDEDSIDDDGDDGNDIHVVEKLFFLHLHSNKNPFPREQNKNASEDVKNFFDLKKLPKETINRGKPGTDALVIG